MLVGSIMTMYPVRIEANATIRRAAELISIAEVSDLMVVGPGMRFVGVLSEGDLIRALLPNQAEILAAGGTLEDAFQYFVRKGHEVAERPIAPLVITHAITLSPQDAVAKAAAIMAEKQIRRLPVVENERLVGTLSRADVVRATIYYAD